MSMSLHYTVGTKTATSEWEEDEEFFKFSRYARNLKVNAQKD